MTISTLDGLIDSMANGASRLILDKASLANQTAGRYCSLWRATGTPAQGANPGTGAVVPTKDTVGAVAFTNQTAPATSYLGYLWAVCSNNAQTLEIHDRLLHAGGFVFNVTSQQTLVGMDLSALGSQLTERMGSADYGDVQWWLEVTGDGGATASNASINVTFGDNTSNTLNTLAVGGTVRNGNLFSLDALKTTAQQALKIRAVNNIVLSASTGTAGSFNIIATRPRATLPMALANFAASADWAALGLPNIPNNSCLFPIVLPSTTSSGTVRGGGKIIHG